MQKFLQRVQRWITMTSIILAMYSLANGNTSPQSFTMNCPANVYVSCTAELWDLSVYGNATYSLNYYTYSAGTPTVTYYLNSCNVGYIKRTWRVEDPYWNIQTCSQYIYVSTTSANQPLITWPKDIELQGCNPGTNPNVLPDENSYPTWVDSECAMLGRSYSDMLFTVNSQCKKIMRTWKVLNWCSGSTSTGYTTYSHTQVIKIISTAIPSLICASEITANSTNCKNADVFSTPLTIDASVCGGNFEITNNSPYATTKGANISGNYPIGTTKVTYTVKYGCGNFKFCTTNVVVKNASTPVPYCIGSLITTLMPTDTNHDGKVDNGMVELWAKDLDRGSKSLCGHYPLKFSFSKDSIVSNKTFTCNQIGKNEVYIYITDSKGSQSACLTEIIIQNNGANIPDCHPLPPPPPPAPKYVVKGSVQSLGDSKLNMANITLKYLQPIVNYTIKYDTTKALVLDSFINASGYKLYRYIEVKTIKQTKDSTLTYAVLDKKSNIDGVYIFDNLTVRNKSIKISATYNDDKHRSIDNKDVELLTKFLLGELTFNSYHQYLAADIDENGVINVQDQNALMAFVTHTVDSLPGKNQWYLMSAKANYPSPTAVLNSPLQNFVVLDSISRDSNIVNFVGIKKGNISVDPGDFRDINVENRSKQSSEVGLTFFPNPFADQLTCQINSQQAEVGRLQILGVNGQILMNQTMNLSQGQNTINIDSERFPVGMLLYRMIVGQKVMTGQMTKVE